MVAMQHHWVTAMSGRFAAMLMAYVLGASVVGRTPVGIPLTDLNSMCLDGFPFLVFEAIGS
jgi:hypothetical protein